MKWLQILFSNNPTARIKRVCYFSAIIASIIWLSVDLCLHKGITDPWNAAFLVFMVSACGAYIGGKTVEAFNKKEEKVEE